LRLFDLKPTAANTVIETLRKLAQLMDGRRDYLSCQIASEGGKPQGSGPDPLSIVLSNLCFTYFFEPPIYAHSSKIQKVSWNGRPGAKPC
jgi:hypothetical protein